VTYSILAVLLGGVLTQEILNYAKRRKPEKAARVEELQKANYVDLQPAEESVDYIEGKPQIAVEGLSVDGHSLATEKTIIATGSIPELPDIPETDDQLDLLEVLTDNKSRKTGKTGGLDVLHDGSAKRETFPPRQTEDTDVAA
jgi:pyruvate/2-oxoglutarate dehydrogenase complex dihydrolipoamide dehydrogenase (E3) component